MSTKLKERKILIDIFFLLWYYHLQSLCKGVKDMDLVQVPRNLILDQAIGDKRVLVYLAIRFIDWPTSFENLILYSGYCADRHAGKAGTDMIDTFYDMELKGYYSGHGKDIQFPGIEHGYGLISHSEFQNIIRARKERRFGKTINQAHLFLLLAYIRCNIHKKAGCPQYYSDLLNRISENIGLSVRSISNGLRYLQMLGIIHSEELPRYTDEQGHWHSNVRIFVNMSNPYDPAYDWKRELDDGKSIILSSQHN